MEAAKMEKTGSFRGTNFVGDMRLGKDSLFLDVTEFKKGCHYQAEITTQMMEREFKRYLVFKRTEDLFQQLAINCNSEVTDENSMLLSFEVYFKGKPFELKVEIPLASRKFNNESERYQSLFGKIEKLTHEFQITLKNEKASMQKQMLVIQNISFKGDNTSDSFKLFEVSQDRKIITKIKNDPYYNREFYYSAFTHDKNLPQVGVYYFQFKVIKTTPNSLIAGVCSQKIKSNSSNNLYEHGEFMGLFLDGRLAGNGAPQQVVNNMKFLQGQVMKVVINMNQKTIKWCQDDKLVYMTQLRKELLNTAICPAVVFYTLGDTIEFIEN